MPATIKDRVGEVSSNTPGSSGTITVNLNGALTSHRTFAAAGFATGATCPVSVAQSNDATKWCTVVATWTDATPDTITFATSAIIDGSAGAGASPSWTGTVDVRVEPIAYDASLSHLSARGHIEGGLLAYNSTTALDISACTLAINGKILTAAATTITSGSTMLDIAGSTVTLGASKAYFVFAYDNSGTLAFRVEERDATGDGADPTWDSNADYWKAASTGLAARRIGKFWTNGSSQIIRFVASSEGKRVRRYTYPRAAVALLSGGTSATYASVTITPYITADDLWMSVTGKTTNSSAASYSNLFLSVDGGNNECTVSQLWTETVSTNSILAVVDIPATGSLQYKATFANSSVSIDLGGFGHLV